MHFLEAIRGLLVLKAGELGDWERAKYLAIQGIKGMEEPVVPVEAPLDGDEEVRVSDGDVGQGNLDLEG